MNLPSSMTFDMPASIAVATSACCDFRSTSGIGRIAQVLGLAVILDGTIDRLERAHHAGGFLAAGQWRSALLDALEEVIAFKAQRLAARKTWNRHITVTYRRSE